jgi:tetratricopeptide (TPR) repeat protein
VLSTCVNADLKRAVSRYSAQWVVCMRLRLFIKALCSTTLLVYAADGADPPDDLIAKGDVFDQRFQATEALECYLPAEKLQPTNVHVLVCIARQYRYLLADAKTREEKLRLGGIALDYAQKAAALAPENAEAQLSVAISYGKMLPFMDTKSQFQASPSIKAYAEKAIKLDPENDLAWHVLGRWHRTLSDVNMLKRTVASFMYGQLPKTTTEKAVSCFEKALEINPRRLMHYIELGRAYAQMGKTEEARRFIEKGLSMPNHEKDDPETKRRGQETLAKLQ